jgi:hypothetical protein
LILIKQIDTAYIDTVRGERVGSGGQIIGSDEFKFDEGDVPKLGHSTILVTNVSCKFHQSYSFSANADKDGVFFLLAMIPCISGRI